MGSNKRAPVAHKKEETNMSVTLNTSTADPRVFAAAQDEAVWRQVLSEAHESHGIDLKGETMALVWTNDRLSAVPRTSLPHRDPSIVGYLNVLHYRIFVYRSDLDVANWTAWFTDAILEIDIAEGFPVADQIYDSEILTIRQSILEEAGL